MFFAVACFLGYALFVFPEATHKEFLSVRREGKRDVRRTLEFYLRMATQNRWSVREVARQLDAALFETAVLSFTRHFYKPQPLRTLEKISADIFAIKKKAEGLLNGLLKQGAR